MNAATENKAEESLEKVKAKKPLAVYSVNFSEALNNFAEKRHIVKRRASAGEMSARGSLSKKIFNRRNAALLAAILTIGVLHFALQVSFIQTEIGKARPALEIPQIVIETPPQNIEPATVAPAPPVRSEPAVLSGKKADVRQSHKAALPLKSRPLETTPVKPPTRKKDAVESRAERLRRAERLLTGI